MRNEKVILVTAYLGAKIHLMMQFSFVIPMKNILEYFNSSFFSTYLFFFKKNKKESSNLFSKNIILHFFFLCFKPSNSPQISCSLGTFGECTAECIYGWSILWCQYLYHTSSGEYIFFYKITIASSWNCLAPRQPKRSWTRSLFHDCFRRIRV